MSCSPLSTFAAPLGLDPKPATLSAPFNHLLVAVLFVVLIIGHGAGAA